MEKEALRVALRSAMHGMRWDDTGRPNPRGQFRAGRDWTDRVDPNAPSMAHPIFRGLTQHIPTNVGERDDSWLFGALARAQGGDNTVVLGHTDLKDVESIYDSQNVVVDVELPPS